MSRKSILLIVLCFVSSAIAVAQSPTLLWSNSFHGNGDNSDRFNKVVPDGTGNYVAVGYTVKPGNYRDLLTVKFNSGGDTLWWRTKNGKNSFDDEAETVAVDGLGNIYVAGFGDWGVTNNDIVLIKYDPSGTKLWDTTWNNPAVSLDDLPVAMALDGNGNIFIAGNTEPDTAAGSSDYITLKFDPNGGLLWASQYSRPGISSGKDEIGGISVDGLGDAYVTGRSFNGGDDDFVTIKYSGSTGIAAWTQIYNGGNGDDRGTSIKIDNAGNVVLTGRSDNGNNDDIRTIKYNSSGVLQWSKAFNSAFNQNDRGLALTVDATNNVYVTGQSDADNSSVTDYDFATLKYNASGVLQWSRLEGSNALQYDIPYDILVDGNGNIVVTGKSDQNPDPLITDNSFMTVMYNNAGTRQWASFHAGTLANGGDIGYSLASDGSSIYVAGGADNIGTQKDAVVIKYDLSGNETWYKNYNGEGDYSESARSMVIDNNDRTYLGGYSFQEGHNRDICLVALNTAGDTICTYLYNGSKSDDDELNAIAQDASGYIYATGYTKSLNQKSDFFTMKWDPSTCDTLWTRLYNSSVNQSDRAESMVVDAAGNVYVTGRSDSDPTDTIDNNDIVTIKYSTSGAQLWLQRFNGTGNLKDEPSKIILDNSGNVLVCGRMEKLNDDDFVILKYDPSTGNPVWASPATYNGPFANDDRPLDMIVDNNNDIFVCGYSQTGSAGATDDAVILKLDPSGNLTGFYGYDGTGLGNDQAVALAHDNQDNIIVTMYSDVDTDPLRSNYNYLTMKFDVNLTPLWALPAEYNSAINGDDVPVAITTNAAGDIFVTGTSETDTTGGLVNHDWITVRYNDQGIQTFVSQFDGPGHGDDSPNAIALRGTSIWVCGYADGTGGNQKDMTANRYDISVGLFPLNSKDNSISVYPNPTGNSSSVCIENKNANSAWTLIIFDVTGRKVITQTNIDQTKTWVSISQFARGFYEYQVIEKDKPSATGKFIIE